MAEFVYNEGMKGRSTEPLVECPYEKSHRITVRKLKEHVEKCRKNYKRAMVKSGGHIDMFVCQHNPQHLVYSPELIFHESRCPDNVIRSHQLNIAPLREAGFEFNFDLADFLPDEKEFADMFGDFDLDMIQGSQANGKKFKIDEIRFPNKAAQSNAEAAGAALAKELEMDMEKQRERERMEQTMTQEELDDYDEWNKKPTEPAFDYMKMIGKTAVKTPLPMIPPGLTKAERKEYEKANSSTLTSTENENESGTATAELQVEANSSTPTSTENENESGTATAELQVEESALFE